MLIEITQDLSMFKHKEDGLNLARRRYAYFCKGKKQKESSLKFKSKVLKKRTISLTKHKSSVLLVLDEAYRFMQ